MAKVKIKSYKNDHLNFTEKHYCEILKAAKRKGAIYLISDYSDSINSGIFIRHDLDLGTERAVAISEIEKKEGVKSTYFVLMHSQFYNLFEKSNHDNIIQIIENGHEIGLHFDCSFYNITNENQLTDYLLFEKSLLEQLYNIKIKTFSFHINNQFTLSCKKKKYANLINAYSNELMHQATYVSDSYGVWRFKKIIDVICSSPGPGIIQILTHPEWWFKKAQTSSKKIKYHINIQNNLMKYTAEKYYMIEYAQNRNK